MDKRQHTIATTRMNIDREQRLSWLVAGGDPDSYVLDEGGWLRVSRHSAGVNSAYKCMELLRLKWITLEFKVRKPKHRARWAAEIWARRQA